MIIKNSNNLIFDVILIPAPSIASLETLIPFLIYKFKELKYLKVGVLLHDLKILNQLLNSNNFLSKIKKYNIYLVLKSDEDFFILPIEINNFEKKLLSNFGISFLICRNSFKNKNTKINSVKLKKYKKLTTLYSIADFKILLTRYSKLLNKLDSSHYLSIRHGINLSPLQKETSNNHPIDFYDNHKTITYFYNSAQEYSFVSKFEHINKCIYKHIPISRHQNDWTDSIKESKYRYLSAKYITIFTRPLSDYIIYSDFKLYKEIFWKLSQDYPDIEIIIKPHPKEKVVYFEKFLKSLSLSNKIIIERNVGPLNLAFNSVFCITLYSGLSVDFSFYKIPHLELYFPSLSRFNGYSGYFLDIENLPSLDFRGFGLASALISTQQLDDLCKRKSSYKNRLLEFHHRNYVSIFNKTS